MRRFVRVLSLGADFRDMLGGDCEDTNENLIAQSDGAIRARNQIEKLFTGFVK
jgi:hypothetical protein